MCELVRFVRMCNGEGKRRTAVKEKRTDKVNRKLFSLLRRVKRMRKKWLIVRVYKWDVDFRWYRWRYILDFSLASSTKGSKRHFIYWKKNGVL